MPIQTPTLLEIQAEPEFLELLVGPIAHGWGAARAAAGTQRGC